MRASRDQLRRLLSKTVAATDGDTDEESAGAGSDSEQGSAGQEQAAKKFLVECGGAGSEDKPSSSSSSSSGAGLGAAGALLSLAFPDRVAKRSREANGRPGKRFTMTSGVGAAFRDDGDEITRVGGGGGGGAGRGRCGRSGSWSPSKEAPRTAPTAPLPRCGRVRRAA